MTLSYEPTLGDRLISLKERSGLSLAQIAAAAGYKGASSIQKLFARSYDGDRIKAGVAQKLAQAFVGKGSPPITESEVLSLAGQGDRFEKAWADVQFAEFQSSKFIIVHRTSRVGTTIRTEEGSETPLFVLKDDDDAVSYFEAGPVLQPKRVEAMHITVGNMWPRYEEGEVVFYERVTPASQGDDVVVRLIDDAYLDGTMVLGRLRMLNEEEIHIDQLSPKGRIILPRDSLIAVYRLLQPVDFLPTLKYASFD